MGVDYDNCEFCNEIYADCSDYGSCKICKKNACPSCYYNDFNYYKLDNDVYWSTCRNHDFMYDSDSDEDSAKESKSEDESDEDESECSDIDIHAQEKKNVLDSVNGSYECKNRGIVIPNFKYLQSLQTGIHCVDCNSNGCNKTKKLNHKEIKCCVCSSKDGSNICKKCKKGTRTDSKRSIVLINADLISACEKGNLQDAVESIKNGATNFVEGLNKACMKGHIELVKLMITEATKTSTILNYDTAIDFAFQNDRIDVIDYLLTEVPMADGVKSANDYVEFIFKKVPAKYGYNSSITYNYTFDVNMYNILLKHGLKDFNVLLNLACLNNSQELVDLSIAAGATNFNEAMVFACLGDRENMVNFMLTRGANNYNECLLAVCSNKKPIYYDKDGREPNNSWHNNNNTKLVKLFLDRANNLNECLIAASREGFKDTVILLVNRGATHINLAKHTYLKCYNKTADLSNYFNLK